MKTSPQTTDAKPRLILGIDPGLNTTGYGILNVSAQPMSLVEAGVIRSTRSRSLERRLVQLYDGLVEVIESLQPSEVAMEELYTHYDRPDTAILMGHARGVYCLVAAQHQLPVYHYRATQIKKMLTGNGRAPKSQVQLSVAHQLQIGQALDPPDVADALAIAITHFYISRNPLAQI